MNRAQVRYAEGLATLGLGMHSFMITESRRQPRPLIQTRFYSSSQGRQGVLSPPPLSCAERHTPEEHEQNASGLSITSVAICWKLVAGRSFSLPELLGDRCVGGLERRTYEAKVVVGIDWLTDHTELTHKLQASSMTHTNARSYSTVYIPALSQPYTTVSLPLPLHVPTSHPIF
jgi:hypothetical protein